MFMLLITGCFSDENKTNVTDKTESNITATKTTSPKIETKSEKVKQDKSKEEAPLFSITTLEGKTLTIDEIDGGLNIHELKDKVVFLLFFGHQCPPCLAEIPELISLTKEGHKDLAIVALEVQGLNEDRLKNFAKYKGINYNLIVGDENQDLIGYIAQKAGWSGGIPFLLAMDKKGVVQVVHTGGLGKTQFDNIYNQLKVDDNKTK